MSLDFATLESHRPALTGHCYRLLGSLVDADDAVQETLVRAWKSMERFDGRASPRTWLYRIATNVCLDTLADQRSRRVRVIDDGPRGTTRSALIERPRSHWLEPVPDLAAIPTDCTPAEQLALRQSIRLAFVAALQHLPPRQRAVLLLMEVLGWSAREVAEGLDLTVAAVNSALQRARATLATKLPEASPAPLEQEMQGVVDRFMDAFERYDVEALAGLLTDDATLCMPPYSLWLQGRSDISDWLLGPGIGCRGSRLVPVQACGQPAFGQYRQGGAQPWALVVLDMKGSAIVGMTYFLDTAFYFPRFGLPLELKPA